MSSRTPKNLILLLSLIVLTFFLAEATIYYLDLNTVLYKNLSEQLTLQQLEEYLAVQKRWSWVQYALLPLALWLKTTLLAWVLAIGGFFQEIELPHKTYWNIALKAESVFLFMALVKMLWFLIIEPDFEFERLQSFTPFSLESILHTENLPRWALYPLQLVNFFEVVYWMLLVLLLNEVTRTRKGFTIVATSYAPALFVWMIFIMFLTLNFS